MKASHPPFLRIPPFPGYRPAKVLIECAPATVDNPEAILAALRLAQVGGSFWAAPISLAAGRNIILAPDDAKQAQAMLAKARAEGVLDRVMLAPDCVDAWAIAELDVSIWAGANTEWALIAAILGKPLAIVGEGRYQHCQAHLADCAALAVAQSGFVDPYTGAAMDGLSAIALLAKWRRLIFSNRSNEGIFGLARWKRVTVDSLLWDGTGPVRHRSSARGLRQGARVLAWKSRTRPRVLADLARQKVQIGEIEDGMIRSSGLGANCVPPLSVLIDFAGAHFDPAQASGLETILQTAEIGKDLITRAAALRQRLVAEGIGKYGREAVMIARPAGNRRRVMVTGQVEDDRAVLSGGAGLSNLEVLRRARADEPQAEILYKPHPDVEAGHRKGHIPDAEALKYADYIERDAPIAALLGAVDGLHVISSLAGFEGLMRGLDVTTHGVPFYAGWGLTRDLGPVPKRRNQQRSLDELVAAVLILYPRYVDPVTRLPCSVEVLVERLAKDQARVHSPLVRLREIQGGLNRLWRRAI